jgi:hypothetical protein
MRRLCLSDLERKGARGMKSCSRRFPNKSSCQLPSLFFAKLRLLASCSLYPLATLRALLTFLFLSRSSAERLDSGQGLLCGDWRLENTFSDNLICYWRDGGIEGEVGRGGRRHPLLLEENDNNKTRFMDIEEPLIARRPSSTSSSSRRRKRGCTQK